jgi:DNA-binding NtrC family response regulator
MESKFEHKVLIVDNDKLVGKIIGDILKAEKIDYTFATNGKSALNEIKKIKKPFSLIICDQHLSDINGIKVLEQVKNITHISIRFLMTDYSQIETITDAVNKGSIQKYIAKPLNQEDLTKTIRSGISLLEDFLENEKLFKIAKQQNAKLYELDCELMEHTTSNNKEIHDLNQDIEKITRQIKTLHSHSEPNKLPDKLIGEIESLIKNPSGLDQLKAITFFSETIRDLHGKFRKIAHKNNFEMLDIEGDD